MKFYFLLLQFKIFSGFFIDDQKRYHISKNATTTAENTTSPLLQPHFGPRGVYNSQTQRSKLKPSKNGATGIRRQSHCTHLLRGRDTRVIIERAAELEKGCAPRKVLVEFGFCSLCGEFFNDGEKGAKALDEQLLQTCLL